MGFEGFFRKKEVRAAAIGGAALGAVAGVAMEKVSDHLADHSPAAAESTMSGASVQSGMVKIFSDKPEPIVIHRPQEMVLGVPITPAGEVSTDPHRNASEVIGADGKKEYLVLDQQTDGAHMITVAADKKTVLSDIALDAGTRERTTVDFPDTRVSIDAPDAGERASIDSASPRYSIDDTLKK